MSMHTDMLYMKDCYLKEFKAKVLQKGEDGGRPFVILDRTAFYPAGGGQPSDKGSLNGIPIIIVRKDAGVVKHFLEKPVESDTVEGTIDWNSRHVCMRMHTAQHLLSAIILEMWGAPTAGNQIDLDSSRIDFHPLTPPADFIDIVTEKFNEIVDEARTVDIYFTTRDEVLRTIDERRRHLFARLAESIKEIRIIEIRGVDKVPCGGTHVSNTKEIGHIRIAKLDNKGKDTWRVRFALEKPQAN